MSTISLEKERWQSYFDNFSKVFEPAAASLEIVSIDVGDQPEVSSLTLNGVTYDPRNDVLELQLGDQVDHLIQQPKEVYVTETDDGFASMEVVDKEGAKHILTVKAQA
jgi:hypothetical protein